MVLLSGWFVSWREEKRLLFVCFLLFDCEESTPPPRSMDEIAELKAERRELKKALAVPGISEAKEIALPADRRRRLADHELSCSSPSGA